jgi:hypothetical protein
MPSTVNLKSNIPGINPAGTAAQSVRVWSWSGAVALPIGWSAQDAVLPGGEVALSQATSVIYEGWTGKNATGTWLGRGAIFSDSLLSSQYSATDVDSLLATVFPPQDPNA